MDQLTACLDRGWDLAQKGDTRGAETSARQAIELCPESPEAHNLLGFIASLDGDCDEAVEAYQQAIALDDTYVEAMLNAAELLVHPIGDFEQALGLCEAVLDISEYDDEILDAMLLKFEALWGMGEDEQAKKLLQRLPAGPYESAVHNFLAGRALFEVGELDRAKPLLDAALAGDPVHAEAHYYQGMLAEHHGDRHGANVCFLRVRQLEIMAGLPPWSPNEETFMKFVDRAAQELPTELRDLMKHAEVYVVDMPGPELIVDGVDVHALALIDAVQLRPAGATVSNDLGMRVFLYAANLLRAAGSVDAVQGIIRDALERELKSTLDDLRGTGPAN
jgi:tetratricopeptide (TPR) repeat protein